MLASCGTAGVKERGGSVMGENGRKGCYEQESIWW